MGERGRDSAPQEAFVSTADGLRYPSPTYAAAFLGLVRAGDLLERKLDAELRRAHGLGLREFEVLLHLAVFSPDRRLPMNQLTRQAPLSQSRMSRLVADLERQGLVSREVDERDSRALVVAITDRGLGMLREAQETHYRGLDRHLFSHLTAREVALLAKTTGRLLDGISE